jgi:predicted site-specific integrase-resolvase
MTIYKTKDLARILQIHPATLANWALRGLIHGTRLGKSWFFTEDDLKQALEANRR